MILEYFGDEAEVIDCRCDICRPDDATDDAPAEVAVLSDEAILLVRQLLSGVARLQGKFGVNVVAEVLAGSESDKTQRWGFDRLTVFGLLRAHPIKRIVAMLHRVMEAGLARQRDPDGVRFRPVVELTAAGIAVMKGLQPPPTSLADLIPRRTVVHDSSERNRFAVRRDGMKKTGTGIEELAPDAAERFARLRAARAQIARERDVPAYCICHDSTLKLIASAAPADPDALEQIKGMGPHKVRLYGPALLEAVGQAQ
jgi:ATP-dependent DNA helicase RecQ